MKVLRRGARSQGAGAVFPCANVQRLPATAAAVCALVLAAAPASHGAPISFITAIPVAKDQAVLRTYAQPSTSGYDNSALNRNLWDLNFPFAFAWGPTSRLALFGSFGPDYRFMNENTSVGREARSASGFNDTALFLRYTLYQRDSLGQTIRFDPLAGFYIPTGWYNKSDMLGRLPNDVQNGSGSVDPYVGFTSIWKTFYNEVDQDFTWRGNPAASGGYQEGDSIHLDFAYYRLIVPWRLPEVGLPSEIWAGVETNVIWDGKDRINHAIADNTGGLNWYVGPGAYMGTDFWTTGAMIQLPAYQNLCGPDRLTLAWRFYFYFEYYFMMPSLPFRLPYPL